ncbi:hypothetical protein M407DRAFT_246196, partial [Tulasnella calospora MUT 4182]
RENSDCADYVADKPKTQTHRARVSRAGEHWSRKAQGLSAGKARPRNIPVTSPSPTKIGQLSL